MLLITKNATPMQRGRVEGWSDAVATTETSPDRGERLSEMAAMANVTQRTLATCKCILRHMMVVFALQCTSMQ